MDRSYIEAVGSGSDGDCDRDSDGDSDGDCDGDSDRDCDLAAAVAPACCSGAAIDLSA